MTETTLADLVEPGRKICYGIVQPGAAHAGGVPILRVNNFGEGGLTTEDVLRIDPAIAEKYPRSKLRGGELLVTLVGSVGQVTIAPRNLSGWNVARAVGVVPIADPVMTKWASYVVRSSPAQAFLGQRANTTVQTTVNLRDLALLPIPLLPRAELEVVIVVLSALDDKIELNRRMNETLEHQARALFRDWFVDFGPVKAKMAGDTPYLAPDLWSLFPDRLDDDGVPEGWRTYRVDEIANHHTKSLKPMDAASEVFEHFSLPAYDGDQQPVLEVGGNIKSNKTIVPDDAILLSKLNPEISRVWWPQSKGAHRQIASTEFLAFTAKSDFSPALLYSLFNDPTFRQRLESMVTGTSKSHQRVSPPALRSLEALVGDQRVFATFGEIATSLMQKVLANRAENLTLAQTRDLLLPKLMSGEIRVGEAEHAAAAAA